MFAPRHTRRSSRIAPLLAGLAAGAVLVGATALVTPAAGLPLTVDIALGAPLTVPDPPATPAVAPPGPASAPRATVPAPAPPAEPAIDVPDPVTAPPVTTPPVTTPPVATPEPTAPPAPVVDPPEPRRAAPSGTGPAAAVVDATNAERAEAGCPDLRIDPRLDAAAQGHARDMAENDYFSHTSEDGRTFDERISAEGHPAPGGENIAAGQRSAEEVVQAWMNSPGHRANILNCDFSAIGVGYAADGDQWVQNFGY